jgi:hypothetical protein
MEYHMNSTIITLIAAGIGVALLAAARQGLKSYRVKGKLDGSVIADALEAGIDTVDKTKKD